jgi:hypothetical protein
VHLTGTDFFLWALGFLLDCVLLAVLLRFKRAARFPIFTALIAFDIVQTIALYFIQRNGSSLTYFYSFWSLGFLDAALQLGVAYELCACVFRPLGPWAPDVQRSFTFLIGISLLLASGLTWLAAPPTHYLRSAIVIRGDFFGSVLMSELFVAMIALSVTMGLPWRTHVARLTQGFGAYSIFGILVDGAHTYFGTTGLAFARISHIRISLYCACLAYWIFAMAQDEPEPRMPDRLRAELFSLQKRTAMVLRDFRELREV